MHSLLPTLREEFEAGGREHGGLHGIFQAPVPVQPEGEFLLEGNRDYLVVGVRVVAITTVGVCAGLVMVVVIVCLASVAQSIDLRLEVLHLIDVVVAVHPTQHQLAHLPDDRTPEKRRVAICSLLKMSAIHRCAAHFCRTGGSSPSLSLTLRLRPVRLLELVPSSYFPSFYKLPLISDVIRTRWLKLFGQTTGRSPQHVRNDWKDRKMLALGHCPCL